MLNAAVPMEAYYEGDKDDLMVDGAWKGIDERFRASSFAALFASATNDFRCGLSWSGVISVRFQYYLNPTPLDRNLEWDMRNNGFKGECPPYRLP